jgi:hypothetical protein
MRKLIVLLLIVGLLIAGDVWLKWTAEKRVATELQSSFDSSGNATVDFGGFPFFARLIAGSIPLAQVNSSSLTRRGVRFTDIRMTLQDVGFSWSRIISGEVGSVTIRDGHGRATLGPEVLSRAFAGVGSSIEVDLNERGLEARVGPVRGSADLSLDGTDLVLSLPELDRTFSVGLPRFVQGLQYRSVRIDGGHAIIEFSLEKANLRQL